MARLASPRAGLFLLAACTLASGSVMPAQPATPPQLTQIDQGPAWTDVARAAFYVQDQGSRLMKLSWFKALRQADGQPFAADRLARYGYLRNDAGPAGLPQG